VVDAVVAYDARHDTWLVGGLGALDLDEPPGFTRKGAAFVSLSTDKAQMFSDPVMVERARSTQMFNDPRITCDNFLVSPYYGNCYMAWYEVYHGGHPHVYRSTDGGLSWTRATITPKHQGLCVVTPHLVVQPDGDVVLPYYDNCETYLRHTLVSTDGGVSYHGPFDIPTGNTPGVPGGLRTRGDSFAVDADGTIYGVWPDCTFRRSRVGTARTTTSS